MRLQDFIIQENTSATEALFEAARKVPADKLDWTPLDNGRSVLDICQECAMSTRWATGLMVPGAKFEMTPEVMAQFESAKAALKTLDECEAAAKQGVDTLNATIDKIPDDHLTKTAHLPFGPSPDWPISQVAGIHAWNCRYHVGQINYIQTLYGDKAMG